MTVRVARPSDLPVALSLWEALHRAHEALDPRYRLGADAGLRWSNDFRTWTRSATDRVWLALDGGPVGLLTGHLYEPAPTFAPFSMVYVDDLYVAPAARGAGVATALLDAARAWGREEGATQLRAGVLARNEAGRAFWARQGTEDLSVTVTVDL
ncbi:MAG: GNAT family N-acetyltransferase [Bacteroidota bacterium]